jgi:hypothetical protein
MRLKFNSALLALLLIVQLNPGSLAPAAAQSASQVSVLSQVAGPTPFIEFVNLANVNPAKFSAVSFWISPKVGATAKAASAKYSRAYLEARGDFNASLASLRVPVTGLYQGRVNQVTINYYEGLNVTTISTQITTQAWPDGRYLNPQVLTARNKNVALDYSYIMLKNWSTGYAPSIVDIDGELRWVGAALNSGPSQASTFQNNGVLYGSGTSLLRLELDGSYRTLADYRNSADVTNIGLHNYDAGKYGTLIEVDRSTDIEATILEVDATGALLNTFDLSKIVEDEMRAGGDDPSNFVRRYADWFHNNAATYWKTQDTLVVSSRENFVIGIDYETKKIKWILGDPTKYWHSFASLRKYALDLKTGGEYPLGQHAVSITSQDELMLFDNGTQSFNQPGGVPVGESRSYAAPRRYRLDLAKGTAEMIWAFDHGKTVYSPICSSIYQDGKSFIVDYASVDWGQSIRLMGLGENDQVAFEYQYPGDWSNGWNAQPVHLENLNFLAPVTYADDLPTLTVRLSAKSGSISAGEKLKLRTLVRTLPFGATAITTRVTGSKTVLNYLKTLGYGGRFTLTSASSRAAAKTAKVLISFTPAK